MRAQVRPMPGFEETTAHCLYPAGPAIFCATKNWLRIKAPYLGVFSCLLGWYNRIMNKRKVDEVLMRRRLVFGLIGVILILCAAGFVALKVNIDGNKKPSGDSTAKYSSSDEIEQHFYDRYGANDCKFEHLDGGSDSYEPVRLSDCEYEGEVVGFMQDKKTDDLLSVMLPRRDEDMNAKIKAISGDSDGITFVMYDGLDDKKWGVIPNFDSVKSRAVYVEIGFSSINEERSLVRKYLDFAKQNFPLLEKEDPSQKSASAIVLSFKNITIHVRTHDNLVLRYSPDNSLIYEEMTLDKYLSK
mgnify:CR=1 FL=1